MEWILVLLLLPALLLLAQLRIGLAVAAVAALPLWFAHPILAAIAWLAGMKLALD